MAVGFDKLFNLDDSVSDLNKAISAIEKLGNVYKNTLGQMTDELKVMTKAQEDLVKQVQETGDAQKKLDLTTAKGRQEAEQSAKTTETQKEQYLYLTKQIKDLEGNIKALKSEENKFNKERETTLKTNRDLVNLSAKLSGLSKDEAQETAKLKTQIQQKNKELKESAKESLGLVSLYQKETKQLNDLRNKYKDVAIQYGVNSKEAKELGTQVAALDSKIKEIDASAGQFQRNVGNYPEIFQSIGGATGAAASGVQGLGASLKALMANPIVALIAAIVAGVTLLFNAFKKTTGGAEKFEQVLGALSTTFNTIIGRIGRFITGELSFKELLFDTADAVKENVNASNQLIKVRRELERASANLALNEAVLTEALQKQTQVRDNDTVSLKQRAQAATEAIETAKLLSKERTKLSQKELEEASLLLQKSVEGTEKRRKAEIAYTEAVAKSIQVRTQNQQEEFDAQRELQMIRLDQFEQELDLLLDIEDRRKSVNERTIADEKTTLSKKQELLRENVGLIEDSYKDQIAIFKEFFGVQLDEQKILELNGKELFKYTANLGLSERAVNRLREVVIEKLAADRDNLDSIRDVNEALKIQNNLSSTFAENQVKNDQKRATSITKINEQIGKSISSMIEKTKEGAVSVYESFLETAEGIRFKLVDGLERFKESLNETSMVIRDGLMSLTQFQNGMTEKRIIKLEEQKEREIKAAGENTKKKEAIEKRYDARIEALEQKQLQRKRKIALFEKGLAIANAIINTAAAVAEALPNIGKSIIVGVLGALKVGAIAATPIPQFAEGTDFHKGGLAIVGDGGKQELISEPNGRQWLSPNKSTLVDLPRGAKVMDGITTQKMLRDSQSIANRALALDGRPSINVNVSDNSDKLVKAIQDRPEQSWEISHGRLTRTLRKGNATYKDWDSQNSY